MTSCAAYSTTSARISTWRSDSVFPCAPAVLPRGGRYGRAGPFSVTGILSAAAFPRRNTAAVFIVRGRRPPRGFSVRAGGNALQEYRVFSPVPPGGFRPGCAPCAAYPQSLPHYAVCTIAEFMPQIRQINVFFDVLRAEQRRDGGVCGAYAGAVRQGKTGNAAIYSPASRNAQR